MFQVILIIFWVLFLGITVSFYISITRKRKKFSKEGFLRNGDYGNIWEYLHIMTALNYDTDFEKAFEKISQRVDKDSEYNCYAKWLKEQSDFRDLVKLAWKERVDVLEKINDLLYKR